MAKYDPLRRWLESRSGRGEVAMSFADIETVIGAALPASAFHHSAWWANETGQHVQAAAWLGAGFVVDGVDRPSRTVTFRPGPPA